MKNSIQALILCVPFILSASVWAQTAGDYLDRGNDYYKQSNLDKALSDYTQAIDIDPTLSKAYNNRGVVYAELGRLTEAIDDFTMAIANDPDDATGYNNRGHSLAQQGNFPDAIPDFTKAININPNYEKSYINRGMAFYNMKEYKKAWADVYQAELLGAAINPDFIEDLKNASDKANGPALNI